MRVQREAHIAREGEIINREGIEELSSLDLRRDGLGGLDL